MSGSVCPRPAADREQDRERLLDLLKTLSFQRGTVRLASGKLSDFYIDCKKTALHPEGMSLCGRLLNDEYERLGLEAGGAGGPTLGADPLTCAFCLEAWSRGRAVPAFIIRKEAKDHGTSVGVEGLTNVAEGAALVLLEDVVTTGGSTLRSAEALRQAGRNPIHVLALVDRLEGGRETLEAAGLGFTSLYTRRDFLD